MGGMIQSINQAPQTAPAAADPMAAPGATPTGGSDLKNPILKQIESSIEAKVSPKIKKTYLAIVVSAMKLCFDEKTNPSLIKGLKSSADIPKNVSLICAGMLGTIYKQSGHKNGQEFVSAAVPASMTLMCQILQFAEQSGMIQLTPQNVSQCAALTSQAVLKKFGIDHGKVQQAVAAGQAKAGGSAAPTPPAAPAPANPAVGA